MNFDQEVEELVGTTDIIELVGLTAVFVAFAATIVWAGSFFQRLTATRASVDTSSCRKRRSL